MRLVIFVLLFPFILAADDSTGMSRYELLFNRNIFDGSRKVREKKVQSPKPPAPKPKPKDDFIQLVGVIVLDDLAQAILQGSTSSLSKTVKASEEFEGISFKQIATVQATVVIGDQEITWPVGKSLRRRKGETWRTAFDSPPALIGAPPESSSTSTSAGSNAPTSSKLDRASILERLRARRQKELKK